MTKTYSHEEHHRRMMDMARAPSKKHSDAKEDRGLVHKMVKKEALTGRKHGGKSPPKSQTNIVIAGRGGAGGPPPGAAMAMPMPAGGPPVVPMAKRPMPVLPGGAGGPGPAGPGAPPVGIGAALGAKRGGAAKHKKRANGGPLGSSPDIARKFERKSGGEVANVVNPLKEMGGSKHHGNDNVNAHRGGGKVAKRAAGGRMMGKDIANVTKPKTMTGYDAGACSGEGRLEKEKNYGNRATKTPGRYNINTK